MKELIYDSVYSIKKAQIKALGGDDTLPYDSVYEAELELLKLLEEGGGGGGLKPVVVDELPETGEEGKIYFVPNEKAGEKDNYKEYIWANGAWELIGNADVDLTDYYTKLQSDAKYNPINTVTASTSGYKFPKWNAYGQITGSTTAYQSSFSINGGSKTMYTTASGSLTGIYAPTSAGTAGQILLSNGSAKAPSWGELPPADATFYLKDSDAEAGTYTEDISNFYSNCASAGRVNTVQIIITNEDQSIENYLPSACRYYEGNVEIWLMYTEDGTSWDRLHYLITNTSITKDVQHGTFGN